MTTTEPTTTALTGTWTIDAARSTVGFSVKHLGFLRVSGTMPIGEGKITVGEDLEAASVTVELDPAGFDTGTEKRDEHVRSGDFLDVEQFPSASYRSTGVEQRGTSFTVHGELTVHGQSRPVTLVGETTSAGDGEAAFTASATVDRHDFGVSKMPGFVAGKHVAIELEIIVTR
ncbi:MAG: YceI family protein [Acidimicrobiales bacterium]